MNFIDDISCLLRSSILAFAAPIWWQLSLQDTLGRHTSQQQAHKVANFRGGRFHEGLPIQGHDHQNVIGRESLCAVLPSILPLFV